MSFARCYVRFFPFCFASKQFESIPICNNYFSEFCLSWKTLIKNHKLELFFCISLQNNFRQNRVEASSSFLSQAKHKYLVSRLRILYLENLEWETEKHNLDFSTNTFLTITFSNFSISKSNFYKCNFHRNFFLQNRT